MGGAIVGAGVACMHYTGMLALELPGTITWSFDLVLLSIALGVALGGGRDGDRDPPHRHARHARRRDAADLGDRVAPLHRHGRGHHRSRSDADLRALRLSDPMLAIAIAATAVAVLGISLIGAIADSHAAAQTRQFARARQQLIADSEEQLREQNVRLDAALNNMSQGVCMFDDSARIVVYNRRFLEMYKLSPQVVRPGCTLFELIRHRKEVGLLDVDPSILPRILEASQQGRTPTFTVKATDGRLIQAVNQPMPGGGWVTTHEDITERDAEERFASRSCSSTRRSTTCRRA